jgi:acyl-CoA thioesterase-1
MTRTFLLLLCLSVLAPIADAAATQRILVVGDSLSAGYGLERGDGWVALLRQRLARRDVDAEVVNASVSGDTTRGGLARLPAALDQHNPDVVIIELGGNDGLRGVPLSETGNNLSRMVGLARERNARVLLVGVRLPPNYGAAFVARFQEMFHSVAREHDIPLVPKLLAGVAEDPGLMQADGIHPNAAAQPKLLENVWGELAAIVGLKD